MPCSLRASRFSLAVRTTANKNGGNHADIISGLTGMVECVAVDGSFVVCVSLGALFSELAKTRGLHVCLHVLIDKS